MTPALQPVELKVKVVKTIIPGPFCSPFRRPIWWWKMRHMRADIRAMEKENALSPLPLHIKRAIERAEHDAFLNGGGV
jgi:hypothetical protein